jgi:DNA-binding protein YbaB
MSSNDERDASDLSATSDAQDSSEGEGTELGAPGLPGLGELGSISPLGGLSGLFGQARDQLEEAALEAGKQSVVGRAGGGSVEIELNGDLEALSVKISEEVVDPDDVGLLEDLVLAALRHALADALEVRERAAGSLFPPGLDLGAMVQGLFGGVGGAGAGGGAGSSGSSGPDQPPAPAGLGIFGSLGASLPAGMPSELSDFMNELFGAEGPVAELDLEAQWASEGGDEGGPGADDDEASADPTPSADPAATGDPAPSAEAGPDEATPPA